MKRFVAIFACAAIAASGAALAQVQAHGGDAARAAQAGEPNEATTDLIGFAVRDLRMTVPVSISGQGPFPFIVDTGAERTVISRELAGKLRLAPGKTAVMSSMSGVDTVETALIPQLQLSGRTVADIHAPALREANLGAQGMLGVDTLQSQQVVFDFEQQTMSIAPSPPRAKRKYERDAIVVKGRSLFGRLVLMNARLDGEKVWVVVDTGSEATIGNDALRRRLAKKRKLGKMLPAEIISVTGESIAAQYTSAKSLELGGVTMQDMPIAFADVHPFKKLQLTDRPALLLGMDALKNFRRVSVDFAERRVRFVLPRTSTVEEPVRLASR